MLEKLKSRKFILAVVAMIIGVVTALAELGGEVGAICGIIAAIASPMVYIIVEGNIDAIAVELATEATKEIVEILKDNEETTENGGVENGK